MRHPRRRDRSTVLPSPVVRDHGQVTAGCRFVNARPTRPPTQHAERATPGSPDHRLSTLSTPGALPLTCTDGVMVRTSPQGVHRERGQFRACRGGLSPGCPPVVHKRVWRSGVRALACSLPDGDQWAGDWAGRHVSSRYVVNADRWRRSRPAGRATVVPPR